MDNYSRFVTMLSAEFQKYLMENEAFSKEIPTNAMVVFQVDGEDNFNQWHEETSLKNRETDQPVIFVQVKKWRKHSSIEELHVAQMDKKLKTMSIPSSSA